MKTKEELALCYFQSGLNCAQSVLLAYSEDYQIDLKMALGIASGFGAGMGRLQETCGAVTGSFMALGIISSKENPGNEELICSRVQIFGDKFIFLHDTLDCKSLLNCDLKTMEGRKYFEDNNLCEKVCKQCIRDSITIIEELIERKFFA